MAGQGDLGERRSRLDPKSKAKPGAGSSMARCVPGEALGRPASRMGRQHEFEEFRAMVQPAPQIFPIIHAGLDELPQSLELDAPNGSLDVKRLEVIAQMGINVL